MKCRLGRFNQRQHWRRSDRAREGELEGIELSALDKFAYSIVEEVDKTSDHASDATQHNTQPTTRDATRRERDHGVRRGDVRDAAGRRPGASPRI